MKNFTKNMFLILLMVFLLGLPKLSYSIEPEMGNKQKDKEQQAEKLVKTAQDFTWENKKFSFGLVPSFLMQNYPDNYYTNQVQTDFTLAIELQLRYWPIPVLQLSFESAFAYLELFNKILVGYGQSKKNFHWYVEGGAGLGNSLYNPTLDPHFLLVAGGGVEWLVFKPYAIGMKINTSYDFVYNSLYTIFAITANFVL